MITRYGLTLRRGINPAGERVPDCSIGEITHRDDDDTYEYTTAEGFGDPHIFRLLTLPALEGGGVVLADRVVIEVHRVEEAA